MKHDKRAPKFSSFITHSKGEQMLVARKKDWCAMGDTGEAKVVDISGTPLSRVAQDSCFIAAEACRSSASAGKLDIIREDLRDAKPYNVDRYAVIEHMADNPGLKSWITLSDTDASPELMDYIGSHVFLKKLDPKGEPWHWQNADELSVSVNAIITKRES